ncbi:MAG: hypothetical protein BA863_16825 [Desulfovibrio sp. S3730MH75]|nr:MAG: hypothetical protein BA863_16825 [Desulfovibrio sp. S3730MH75]
MDLDLMLGLRDHITVGSHIPGKLKLKFDLSVVGNLKVIKYVKMNGFGPPKGQDMPGITKTSFNPLTRSMTMFYDDEIIEPELMHRLFTCESIDEFQETAVELADVVNFDLSTFLN